jgi:hypothetical protein
MTLNRRMHYLVPKQQQQQQLQQYGTLSFCGSTSVKSKVHRIL